MKEICLEAAGRSNIDNMEADSDSNDTPRISNIDNMEAISDSNDSDSNADSDSDSDESDVCDEIISDVRIENFKKVLEDNDCIICILRHPFLEELILNSANRTDLDRGRHRPTVRRTLASLAIQGDTATVLKFSKLVGGPKLIACFFKSRSL